MKFMALILSMLFCVDTFSQTLQLHYDLRHTIDTKRYFLMQLPQAGG